MNTSDTLYIFINQPELKTRIIDGDERNFLLVLVFSNSLSQVEISQVVSLYDSEDIIIDRTMVVPGTSNLEMLRGFASTHVKPETLGRMSIWFPGTIGTSINMDNVFTDAIINCWEYSHPALNETRGLKALVFAYNSYPEYQRRNYDVHYSYAPYLPLVAPVYSYAVFEVIKQVINAYNYDCEQTFVEHWIPEALSRQDVLVHPVVQRSSIVHNPSFTVNHKGCDQEAYEACYGIMRDLYPLNEGVEVFCISLDDADSEWRKNQFKVSAAKYDVDFTLFSAVDGRQWDPCVYPSNIAHRGRRIDWHEPLTGGEVGVVVSHKAIWEASWYNRSEGVIVFEDDAVICKSLDELEIPLDADILMLNDRAIHNHKGEIVEGTCGTDAYVITRRGIYKMLQITEHVNMPLDFMIVAHSKAVVQSRSAASMLHNPLNQQLKTYHHHIFATHNDRGESTIGH